MKKLALHWQILIGMALGVVFGLVANSMGWKDFVMDWIKPFGDIFIRLLKMIAIPIIIASLVKGVADLKDISKFSRIGGRTIVIYITTTIIAITIGLTLVNIIQPGEGISQATIDSLMADVDIETANAKIQDASKQQNEGPLKPLVDIVPENAIKAIGNNGSMLQVIFFSI
ncbi:MAG: cation:dicarboxylase symporter family transporter, partial [Bacteroidota bacterium]